MPTSGTTATGLALLATLALGTCTLNLSGTLDGLDDVPIVIGTPTPTPTPTPTSTPTPFTKPINVAIIGGSITAGTGATGGNGWAQQTGQWLSTVYNGADVRNYSIGGTNSEFATYRIDGELAGFKPDLALIELYVNDPKDNTFVATYTDALINKLRKANPDVVIAYVALTSYGDEATRRAGQTPERVDYLMRLARSENIVWIDPGSALWDKVIPSGLPLSSYLPDGTHPNDKGHALYASVVENALKTYLPFAPAHMPNSLYDNITNLGTARLLPYTTIKSSTCSAHQVPGTTYFGDSLICHDGDTFMVPFHGTTVGLVKGQSLDGADVLCSVDGGETHKESFFYVYSAPGGLNVDGTLIFKNLSDADHVMSCTVAALPKESPPRVQVILGPVLVSSSKPLTSVP